MKVLLILVDGMRPDALNNSYLAQKFIKTSAHTLNARTVYPSVTLPCHMSLFHSVDPMRHGTTTNTYAPQVRPVEGLCEALTNHGKSCSFFYGWEELRDLSRPGSLSRSFFVSYNEGGWDMADECVTEAAIRNLSENKGADFTFLYLGLPDGVGHAIGWMSDEYIEAVNKSCERIERVINALPDEYTVFITSDHGGHERIHGENIPEDMTIPLFIRGESFKPDSDIPEAEITDIAPTIAALLGVAMPDEWEGKSLLKQFAE